ncbi:MAG: DUF1549 domain-containing protein [Armatimonadetes bacterium]|nr:DUF1549 domain-containing protein [Akkermansiaceae bacterium]
MRMLPRIFTFLIFCTSARSEEHWAYIPPSDPDLSSINDHHPVDFLLAKAQKKAGLKPVEIAPPEIWIQRAAYTLTGLPASPEQILRIRESPDEATWKSLVEELLSSPSYGERWARHWMDVARYADTRGYNFDQDNRYPFAYTYRDWLIKSFNNDLPFSDFIKLQIAADHLTDRPDHPDLAALGFITVGPRARDLETTDDRVDVVTRGFLSSTVACARCHKHKFDPITMDDYYSLYSIFENTEEPEIKPVIGKPIDESAFQGFQDEAAKLEQADTAIRQEFINHLRNPEALATYLDLAWLAKTENWDIGKATIEAFKKGRYRAKAVLAWRDFLIHGADGETANPRLKTWSTEMQSANPADRFTLCQTLASEWLNPPDDSALKQLTSAQDCPLNYDIAKIPQLYDTEDSNPAFTRRSALARLQIEHPGSPPRAMALNDKKIWEPAQIYKRGDPGNRGETIERQWLGFLGGGKFPEGKSPRLALAEKIADPANPLTSRVIANRIWAWHFGTHLADPADFGLQQSSPPLLPLLDFLALRFNESGGSIKDLHRLILSSKTFRLAADGPEKNSRIDEANQFFWKWNRRRADFESMRDRLLATSGSLDTGKTGGRSVLLEQASSDRHRSLYAFVDRYALANTFVSFDLPHPDHHAPKRIETTIPQQALFLLNSPLLIRQAELLANNADFNKLTSDQEKLSWLYQRIYRRPPSQAEEQEGLQWLSQTISANYAPSLSGTWEVRHARDLNGEILEIKPFPLFKDNVWSTGPDLATAPVPWLHAGAKNGHAARHFAIILRWHALGAGEVSMVGDLKRTQKGGEALEWNISHNNRSLQNFTLPPEGSSQIEGQWLPVSPGDTVDFVLRAPHGDSFGGVEWNLRVLGRESPDAKPAEINDFAKQFPTSDSPFPEIKAANPWADFIQMLWASNEFNFID